MIFLGHTLEYHILLWEAYSLYADHLSGHNMQDNDLSEFDESREIIEGLVDEYKACESPDYIKWGMEVLSNSILYNVCYMI